MQNIHPTAFIGQNVEIAEDVIIGPAAFIEDDVKIGSGTRVDAFASIKQFTTVGKNNHIHSYAMVGGVPQDLKFAGERTELILGDNNSVREFATLHRGTVQGGGITRIGDNNLFMAYTHVAHDCQLGSNIVMSNSATLAGHVEVGDNAILAGLCAVHQFSRIGKNAFIGGGSLAAQDVPPYMLVVPGPERGYVHAPNIVGLRRLQLGSERVSAIKDAYKKIWRSDMPRKEALEYLEATYDFVEIKEIIEFIRSSERGILTGPPKKEIQ